MKYFLLFFFTTAAYTVNAQSQLLPDQNPNYIVSQQHYTRILDSLEITMNTTVQDTYKAYDWYEAKLEKKQNRVNARYQARLIRAQNSNFLYNNGFNFNNNWDWGCQRFFPSLAYRSNNRWFRW
jgi:hypothetical protein